MTAGGDTAREISAEQLRQWYRICAECGRSFFLGDREDAAEWHYGHDCEAGE